MVLGDKTEFIRLVAMYMEQQGIESQHELYKRFKGHGKRGMSPSFKTISTYFTGRHTPQPWFVRGVCQLFRLSKKQCCELYEAYFESYE